MFQKREGLWQGFVTRLPHELAAGSSFSLMTTPYALQVGSQPLWAGQLIGISQVYLDLQLSEDGTEINGTYSVTRGLKCYTISYFLEDDNLFLDISCRQEPGLLEQYVRIVSTRVRLIFLKLATWSPR